MVGGVAVPAAVPAVPQVQGQRAQPEPARAVPQVQGHRAAYRSRREAHAPHGAGRAAAQQWPLTKIENSYVNTSRRRRRRGF